MWPGHGRGVVVLGHRPGADGDPAVGDGQPVESKSTPAEPSSLATRPQ